MEIFNTPAVADLIKIALAEDLILGDATTEILVSETAHSRAVIVAKSPCIVAGQGLAERIYRQVDPGIRYEVLIQDGDHAVPKSEIAIVTGRSRSILAGERLVLNSLQRLSGISTGTHRAAKICSARGCRVIDTRKTIPGWRILDKYAVRVGGGGNHRMSLGDGILIKNNHIQAAGGIETALQTALAKRRHPMKIQIEVRSVREAERAVAAGAEALLLDNMSPSDISMIVSRCASGIILEASGNITWDNLDSYASTGVHFISMGLLTHSVQAADLAMYIE
ncbi:carboxylating nicotinate-nucleotide diphosphorylase [bacterium]|nr:carboxylating nicotinate-nucleotide diphosphorylase [candidate division CSSED10-310 bacterium]